MKEKQFNDMPSSKIIKEEANKEKGTDDIALSYEDQLHAIEIERLKQEVKQLRQDTHQRKLLVAWVVFMVSAWIIGVLVIVFCYAFPKTNGLSDTVLCTLIRATAIIGLAFIVLRGLFAVKKR